MTTRTKSLPGGRTLVIASIDAPPGPEVRAPFVALLPAFDEGERGRAVAAAAELVRSGCVAICCVGPESEPLHDEIRGVLAATGAASVRMTWDTDLERGCDYFRFAAGGGAPTLLALVAARPELLALLDAE